MARNRRAGEPPLVPTRGPTETPLALLLRARRFRVAAGAERVGANLVEHGAQLSPDAPAWVGAGTPPKDAPTLALAEHAGTLGPRSWGFLNNTQPGLGAVAALDLPAPAALPRSGRLGVIVPERAALPDLIPLFGARDLPVAWIVSVGAGDPADVVSFLSEDASTDAIAIALGPGARAAGLRATLGAKPTVVLGGDPLCRAVARRAGAHVVDRIGEWLALAALLGSGATLEDPVEVWAQGGGLDWLRQELERYQLAVPLRTLDERDPGALAAAIAEVQPPRLVVLVGATPPAPTAPTEDVDALRFIAADVRHPDQVSRLLKALGLELTSGVKADDPDSLAAAAAPLDATLAARVRAEVDGALSDHDAKRLLKAWGVKVTRQGPTGTPTGAIKLAKTIGLPIVIARDEDERIGETLPEVRRIAALLLEAQGDAPSATTPSVMMRERFPEAPRCRLRVVHERGIGLSMRVADALALLPLEAPEALRLAQHAGARRSADQRLLARVLMQIGAMSLAESATLELELYAGAEPVVLKAAGTIKRNS